MVARGAPASTSPISACTNLASTAGCVAWPRIVGIEADPSVAGRSCSLTAADAQHVDEAFQARLATLLAGAGEPVQDTPTEDLPRAPYSSETDNRAHSQLIDKSLLALPEPRRVRDRDHVKSVAKQPCLICGRQPADAHHLRFAQHRGLRRKVSGRGHVRSSSDRYRIAALRQVTFRASRLVHCSKVGKRAWG